MVNQEQHDIDDILKVSDYVRSRGIEKAKKESINPYSIKNYLN